MFLLKKKTFDLKSGATLVPAEEAEAVVKAEEVIAAAEEEARTIIEEAKIAYQAEKERGYADGIMAGKEEILMQKMGMLDETVAYMEGVEGEIVQLVLKALRKCVAEISDEELVFQIVNKSMQALVRTQREITIKVSPEMIPTVQARIDELQKNFPTLNTIDIVGDNKLDNTSCRVETAAGLVEASIDGQLNSISKSIERHFQH